MSETRANLEDNASMLSSTSNEIGKEKSNFRHFPRDRSKDGMA